jgi:hypothetical protein
VEAVHLHPAAGDRRQSVDAIRTIPMLQQDPDKPEDRDTEAEDHAADSVRYAVMSRPITSKPPPPPKPGPRVDSRGVQTWTVDEFLRLCGNGDIHIKV